MRRAVELVALYKRQWREGRRSQLRNWIDAFLEPYPAAKELYFSSSTPLFRAGAKGLRKLIAERGLSWGAPVGTALLARADQALESVDRQLAQVDATFELFMPFIAEERFIFQTKHTRALWAQLSPADRENLPWDPEAMHGGAPAALLARAVERLEAPAAMLLARITIEFLGPVPLAPVEVTAEVPLLQTQSGEVGHTITATTIEDLPLNGRDYTALARLSAGTARPQQGARAPLQFTANGTRPGQNNYMLDGIDNNTSNVDFLGGTAYVVKPPVDAIAEVKVLTSSFGAPSSGRTCGHGADSPCAHVDAGCGVTNSATSSYAAIQCAVFGRSIPSR